VLDQGDFREAHRLLKKGLNAKTQEIRSYTYYSQLH
jgi:hypothetical protein